jgi:GxxExxY protein
MVTEQERNRLDRLTEKIIRCAHEVSNELGAGFLEKVYENALALELHRANVKISQQHSLPVLYKAVLVGDYIADLVIEEAVIVELKAVKALDEIHAAQCLNYLKATKIAVCLLLNFGKPRLEIRRIVLGF